jgi:hypothetical protein
MFLDLMFVAVLASAGQGPPSPFADFAVRVEGYLTVRRAVQRQLPPMTIGAERAVTIRETDALADAIVGARPGARQGDLFPAPIAMAFRAAIAAGCGNRFDELRELIEAELEDTALPPAAVHQRWPTGAPLPSMPPDLLMALPALPAGLEYRFMNRDLVLWDVDANLVLDYVSDAIPPREGPAPASCAGRQ